MPGTTTQDRCRADQYVTWLADACRQMGYAVWIHGKSRRITVALPDAKPYTHETVTLQPSGQGGLWWCWSWGDAVVPGHKIGDMAEHIANVVKAES